MIAGANGVLNSTDFFDSLAPSGIDRTSLSSVAGGRLIAVCSTLAVLLLRTPAILIRRIK